VQNKIDIVKKDDAIRHNNEIKKFLEDSIARDAPIIPVSAQHAVNIDLLVQAIQEYLPTPKRDPLKPPRMHIIRSFDVNKPGTTIEKLLGGVIGGSIFQGSFKIGDDIEIRPGLPIREKNQVKMHELYTEITSLHTGGALVEEALPGGLVGVGTQLDPSLTKSDGLVGSLIGKPGTLPQTLTEMHLDIQLFETVVGTREMENVKSIASGEKLLLNNGTAKTMGVISAVSKDYIEAKLTIPVCGENGDRVALSRRIGGRWRLIGIGVLKD
jgi:translation initiation factor 2 subunit 3